MSRYMQSTYKTNTYCPNLRRSFEDEEDSRDIYRGINVYSRHPNPLPGNIMGVKKFKHIGMARDALLRYPIRLNHSSTSLKLRNVVEVPIPRHTDLKNMKAIKCNLGHTPNRLPLPVGYKSYLPRYEDVSHGKKIPWAEELAKLSRSKEYNMCDLGFMASVLLLRRRFEAINLPGLSEVSIPRHTDLKCMEAIKCNLGHTSNRLPLPVGNKAGYKPSLDDVSHRTKITSEEELDNMFRRKEKRKCELTHMASVLRTETGHYTSDVPGVSKKHVYKAPFLAKGKGIRLTPRLCHPEDPFYSRLTLSKSISGYGGQDHNIRMKYVPTTAGSQLKCMNELKTYSNWHVVNLAYPYRVKPKQNEILRSQEYYRTKPIGYSKKPVELCERKEKSKIFRIRPDCFTALQEHHRPKSLKNLVVVEQSSECSMNRMSRYRRAHSSEEE